MIDEQTARAMKRVSAASSSGEGSEESLKTITDNIERKTGGQPVVITEQFMKAAKRIVKSCIAQSGDACKDDLAMLLTEAGMSAPAVEQNFPELFKAEEIEEGKEEEAASESDAYYEAGLTDEEKAARGEAEEEENITDGVKEN